MRRAAHGDGKPLRQDCGSVLRNGAATAIRNAAAILRPQASSCRSGRANRKLQVSRGDARTVWLRRLLF